MKRAYCNDLDYCKRLEIENKRLNEIINRMIKDKSILQTNKIIVNCSNIDCQFHKWRKGCQHKDGKCINNM